MSSSVTTDVQDVSICQVEGTNNYSIKCSYVEGSDARGCVVSIMVLRNVTTTARSNSEGVTVELVNVTHYNEVVVYDWESDGTFGTLAVRINSTSTITVCPVTVTTTSITGQLVLT